jgi:hypothetical protein
MAWSPFQLANAGIIGVEQAGDYVNPIPSTSATGPSQKRKPSSTTDKRLIGCLLSWALRG